MKNSTIQNLVGESNEYIELINKNFIRLSNKIEINKEVVM